MDKKKKQITHFYNSFSLFFYLERNEKKTNNKKIDSKW